MQSENYFESNQIQFSSFLGKVFLLTEFQAKLFLTQNWPGGNKRDSLLIICIVSPIELFRQ